MGISYSVTEESLLTNDPDIVPRHVSSLKTLKKIAEELRRIIDVLFSIEEIKFIEHYCYRDRPKRYPRVYHTPCNSHAESYIEGNHRECQTTKKTSKKCNKMMTNATKRPTINRQKRQLYGSPVKSYKSKK